MPDDDIDIEVTLDRKDPFTLKKLELIEHIKIVHAEPDYLGGDETVDVLFISFAPAGLPSIASVLRRRAWPHKTTKMKFEGYDYLHHDADHILRILKRRHP